MRAPDQATFETSRARWSAAASCPRWATLGALGAEPGEPDEKTLRLFKRGRQIGQYVIEEQQRKHGPLNVLREKAIPWRYGFGHVDGFVVSDALSIEVKSKQILEPSDADLLQLAGYVEFDEHAKYGVLIVCNPVDLEERPFPLVLTKDWKRRVHDRVEQVAQGIESNGDDMPACVHSTPTGCRHAFCPFTSEAWSGWQPAPRVLTGELRHLAGRLYLVEEAYRAAKLSMDSYKRDRDELRAQLAPHLAAGMDYEAGPVSLKKVEIPPRTTYDVANALKTGMLIEEQVSMFRRVGGGHDRWYLRRNGDEPIEVEDYGEEVPF